MNGFHYPPLKNWSKIVLNQPATGSLSPIELFAQGSTWSNMCVFQKFQRAIAKFSLMLLRDGLEHQMGDAKL